MPFLPSVRLFVPLAALALACVVLFLLIPNSRTESTPPDLGVPVGLTSPLRLAALDGDPASCVAALDRAGIAWRTVAPRTAPEACALDDGIAFLPGGARESLYAPAAPALACPLAARLAVWEWTVVQPAAFALLGGPVVRIDHFGSVACRRIYGRESGAWSQHARARAIDVAGFRLAEGRRITVATDWKGDSPEARFLHRVRDGACRIFGTTLSPDYNAAHRDHLHLDEATPHRALCR